MLVAANEGRITQRICLDSLAHNRDTGRGLRTRQTFTISEAEEELSVSAGWLRFGERLGALPLARRTPGGHRYYTPEDPLRVLPQSCQR
jgi:MerR family regulatory protein